jgi:hypothetical protein
VWSNDLEICVKGSVVTGRASHAGQVKGDDPDQKEYPCFPGWGLGCEISVRSLRRPKPSEGSTANE